MSIILFIALILVFLLIKAYWDHRQMKTLALTRHNSTICVYARSFDYRKIDARLLREVYNRVQQWAGNFNNKPFPIEASDHFNETYHMDPDDLDDIYFEIANKLGISTENPESNPYWNKVNTVKDLVLFLHNQPKTQTQ